MTASPDTDWLDELNRTLAAAPETWPAMVTEHDGIDLAKAFYDAWRPQGARLLAMLTPISDPELAELMHLREAVPGFIPRAEFYNAAHAAIPKISVRITALLATCAMLQRDCDAKDAEIERLENAKSELQSTVQRSVGCAAHWQREKQTILDREKVFADRAERAESALAKLSSRPMPAQFSDESLELMERDAESFSCSDHLRGLIAKYRDLRAWAAEITSDEPSWQTRAARVAEQLEARILSHWSGAPVRDPRGCSPAHALFMAHAIKNRTDGVDSDTKACRWLGWLQCLCAVHRFATLEEMKQMNVNSKNASNVESPTSDEQSPEQKAATLPQEPAPSSTESDAAFVERLKSYSGASDRLPGEWERLLGIATHRTTSPDDAVTAAFERLRKEAIEALRERRDAKPEKWEWRYCQTDNFPVSNWVELSKLLVEKYRNRTGIEVRPLYTAPPKPEPAPRSAAWPTEEDVVKRAEVASLVATCDLLREDERSGLLREIAALSAIARPAPTWCFDMEAAPRDGALCFLLIAADDDRDDALEDSNEATITIGHNNDHNVEPGEGSGWEFAGWDWNQDVYVQGSGNPIAWRLALAAPPARESGR